MALARVIFTPDGPFNLSTDLNRGELSVWDVATRKELKRLERGAGCEGILILPNGKSALIAVTHPAKNITRRLPSGEAPDGDGVD